MLHWFALIALQGQQRKGCHRDAWDVSPSPSLSKSLRVGPQNTTRWTKQEPSLRRGMPCPSNHNKMASLSPHAEGAR
eukprot:3720583-Amphidinium_carterae.1